MVRDPRRRRMRWVNTTQPSGRNPHQIVRTGLTTEITEGEKAAEPERKRLQTLGPSSSVMWRCWRVSYTATSRCRKNAPNWMDLARSRETVCLHVHSHRRTIGQGANHGNWASLFVMRDAGGAGDRSKLVLAARRFRRRVPAFLASVCAVLLAFVPFLAARLTPMKWLAPPVARAANHLAWLLAGVLAGAAALATPAQAQEAFTTTGAPARTTLDGQLVLALPAWMPTGMSEGVGLGFTRLATAGGRLAWGARASWSTATEYPPGDIRRNDDIRMRVFGMIQHVAGRGSFGLRLGLGATAVYDSRTVAQGARAGLTGSDLQQTSWFVFPGADMEGVVVLRVWHSWGMSINGGPTLHLIDGSAHLGWSSGLGLTWQR